jgi:hypothetical protein
VQGAGAQGCRGAGVQGCRGAGVQGCRVQGYRVQHTPGAAYLLSSSSDTRFMLNMYILHNRFCSAYAIQRIAYSVWRVASLRSSNV